MSLKLFEILDNLETSEYEEGWGGITFKSRMIEKNKNNLSTLIQCIEEHNKNLSINLYEDSLGEITKDNFSELDDNDFCKVNINKLNLNNAGEYFYQIFYSKDKFLEWSKTINPFDRNNPINQFESLKIIVHNVGPSFGGSNILISEQLESSFDIDRHLPLEKSVFEQVHFTSQENTSCEIAKFLITFVGEINGFSAIYLNNSAAILCSTFLTEFSSRDNIVLNGIRRVRMRLIEEKLRIDANNNLGLVDIVKWLYEEKTETRIKLFVDRLTLDIDYDKPLVSETVRVMESSFAQAKERFKFVILDRKNDYLKEVRELLKDLKAQADLYSLKIRTLLSNFLRDVLAGLFLVGFSLFTKFNDINNLLNKDVLINFVFKGLGFYFVFSLLYQSLSDITDVIISNKELKYWKNISRETIPKEEFDLHIKKSLKNRRKSFWIIYPLIALTYIGISIIAFCFPDIWRSLSNK